MPNASGVIANKRADGKSIQIDGEWYGAFAPAMLAHANVGDSVSFEYAETAGKGAYAGRMFRNIRGVVKVAGGGSAPVGGSMSTPTAQKPGDPPLHTQRCIIRQSAVNAAIAFHSNNPERTIEEVLATAQIIEAYTSGDADVAAVKEEMGVS